MFLTYYEFVVETIEKSKLIHTFPSITETHEFVVPKSIPMTSFPTGFELKINKRTNKAHLSLSSETNGRGKDMRAATIYLKVLAKPAHF